MTKIIKSKVKANNRHWKNFLDKKYLGSHNLEQGEELMVTIEKFEGEENVKSAQGESQKPVLYFKENVPKMILNTTNGNTITALYGSHPENWVGKKIQIFTVAGNFFGKVQDALRIRDLVPKEKVDSTDAKNKLEATKNADELKTAYLALSEDERNDMGVRAVANKLKKLYATS